jgi:hypothetical protein
MIATSPLTGRIYSGKTNNAGDCFIGKKHDVTGQVLKALIDKASYHGGEFLIEGGGKKWEVTVKEQVSGIGGKA